MLEALQLPCYILKSVTISLEDGEKVSHENGQILVSTQEFDNVETKHLRYLSFSVICTLNTNITMT